MKTFNLWPLYLCICLGIFSLKTYAQELLTPEQGGEITLENNYDIRLAKNELRVDSLGVSPGLAGMLPRVFAQANTNNSIQNITQTRSDGNVIELDRKSTRLNSSHVKISYAVFCLKKKKP